MFTYEEFKTEFVKQFRDYLPAQYQNWEISLLKVYKVNCQLDTVVVLQPGRSSGSPTLYMNEMYDYYKTCGDFAKALRKAAALFVVGMDYISTLPRIEAEFPKDKVAFTVIPQAGNEKFLSNVPHKCVLDFAMIYRLVFPAEDEGFNSCIITNDIAEGFHVTAEELNALAMENMPKILPAVVLEEHNAFVLLTNEKRIFGAASMFYPNVLKEISEHVSSDLCILPASVHEVILVPDVGQNIEEMNRVIKTANTLVEKEEILATHAYHYCRKTDSIRIAG